MSLRGFACTLHRACSRRLSWKVNPAAVPAAAFLAATLLLATPLAAQTTDTPIIQPATGAYSTPFKATMSDFSPGATIYYTTDGTTPTTSSPVYSGPIAVTGSETLQAIATSAGLATSAVATATYTAEAATAAPVISPATGTYQETSPLQVTITAASGAMIYYTTDGTVPTTSSTQYTGPFAVTGIPGYPYTGAVGIAPVRAIAVVSGQLNSPVVSAVYRLNVTSTVVSFPHSYPECVVTGLAGFGPSPTGTITFNDLTEGQSLGTNSLSAASTTTAYAPYSENPTGGVYVVVGDFNGDGKLDLAVGGPNVGISTLLGDGDNTFQPAVPIAGTTEGDAPVGGQMLAGDINGDGKLDLIALFNPGAGITSGTGTGPYGFITMLGNGDGTFQAPVFHDLGLSTGPGGIAGGDFGNGHFDLAFSYNSNPGGAGSVLVLLGNGDGTFQSPVSYPVGDNPTGIIAADFNGDGILDLAVGSSVDFSGSYFDGTVSVLLGIGDGTFQLQIVSPDTPNNYPANSLYSLNAADFTNDGHTDLLASYGYDPYSSSGLANSYGSLLLGNGDGSFEAPQLLGAQMSSIVIGDFNKDGIPDFAGLGPQGILISLSKGDGTFAGAAYSVSDPYGSDDPYFGYTGLAAGDFNGDGYSDDLVLSPIVTGAPASQTSSSAVLSTTFWVPQGTPTTRNYDCVYSGDANYQGSTSAQFTYTFSTTLAAPQFSLNPGATPTVTISGDSGAMYFYTTDGSTPTPASAQYTGPIPVSTTTTFSAIAAESGYQISTVSQATYYAASTPQFSKASGTYTPGQTVSIADSTAGSTIYYTTNGSVPTINSTKYTAPIALSGNVTFNAMAAAPGHANSAVASATYSTTGQSALVSPKPSTALAGPKVTFTWSTVTGATDYGFRLGTTVGGNNLYGSGPIPATSVTLSNLPTNGETIYARLTTFFGASQVFVDYSFTASSLAALTSPTGTVLAGPQVEFTWESVPGADYGLRLGTTVGGGDLYGTGETTATSATANYLPANGETIYARLTTFYGSAQKYIDYVFTAATQAKLTSPESGTVLAGPKVTFSWKAAAGATDYGFRLGTTVGGNDLYGTGPTTATSTTPANLPANGETIYARLTTFYGATQVYTDYVFTASAQSALTSPESGTVLAGPKVTFAWSPAAGATDYGFRLGTTVGGNDLYGSGPVTATSATLDNLPTNGETIYARLTTFYGAIQVYTDYTFTAATLAALTSPAPSSVLGGPQATFTWSAATGKVSNYDLRLGTTVGANNLFGSGTTTAASVTATNLPTNGETIYARLYTNYASGIQAYADYTFTAATQSALTSPAAGSVLAGPSVTFSWSTAPGATDYGFRLGTTVGGNDIYGTGPTTATSATPTNLPTNGETIYARLTTFYGSNQVFTDYVYTAATAKASLTSPTAGSVLTGAKVTFSWTSEPGATDYGFRLGTSVGANNLWGTGPITATSTTPTNLPTNGETIYARLTTFYGSVQVYTDYTFTAAP